MPTWRQIAVLAVLVAVIVVLSPLALANHVFERRDRS